MATPPTVPALTGNDSLNAFADCAVPGAASAGIHGEPSGGVVGLTSDSAMPASTAGCPAAARSRGMGNSSAADAAGSAAGGSGAEGAPTRSASSSMWMASRLVRMSDTRAALAYAPKKQKLVCDDTSKPSADSTRASMSHSCAGVDPGGSISQSDDARGERPEWNLAATHRHAAASIGSCMLRNAGPTARYRSRSAVPWKEASRPRRNLVTTLHIQSISTRRFDGAMLSDREDGGLARHEAASLASQDFNADSISKSAADGCCADHTQRAGGRGNGPPVVLLLFHCLVLVEAAAKGNLAASSGLHANWERLRYLHKEGTCGTAPLPIFGLAQPTSLTWRPKRTFS
eukprot:364848-Chlamydomonas_euryale.AAC.20